MARDQQLINTTTHLSDHLWDLWCIASIIGIWPRFIEPNILSVTRKTIELKQLPPSLNGLKILQFSDLHFSHSSSKKFLKKIQQKVAALNPDIIVFTGDFICLSQLEDPTTLREFFKGFSAPHGCYAVLGNHDYSKPITVNEYGEYDIASPPSSMILQGFSRLFKRVNLKKRTTPRAEAIQEHSELIQLLKNTPFTLLNNCCRCVQIRQSALNICGLGEYTLGKTDPASAFSQYDKRYPGIVLLHNPDGFPLLEHFPGEIVLSGHTHGGQVNLPWLWRKFTLLENPQFKSGLHFLNDKWIYINRGVGAVMPFRWFAPPELLLLTLETSS